MARSFYDFTLTDINGDEFAFSKYSGQVVLAVNTASQCGLTPQLSGLQTLHEEYGDRGLVVLGFPCNDFGAQEPGTHEEICSFYEANHKVSFPLFSKIHVKGEEMHPLYEFLTRYGVSGYKGDIRWNFEKFLIDRKGRVAARFHPETQPTDPQFLKDLEGLLEER